MKNLKPIIPVSNPDCQVNSWKFLLKSAVSDPYQLLKAVGVVPDALGFEISNTTNFDLRVPQPFIDKMIYGDANDPLLLQVLSQAKEKLEIVGFVSDPLAETHSELPGLLHKYHGRVLLILASACAINCRYCFRRHFPYQDKLASGHQLEQSLKYIADNRSISEVILSGGDPLIVSDSALEKLIDHLNSIPHIKRLRIHTRLPVVIPQRLTPKLCEILTGGHLQTSMVLHINHPNEIDKLLQQSLTPFRLAGVHLLNQSVLLKNINNSVSVLTHLSETLYASGIIPYYIHLLDKVAGAAHFDVEQGEAKRLLLALRNQLPGYLVPRLAKEEVGSGAKTVII